jgi:hypothetical protein
MSTKSVGITLNVSTKSEDVPHAFIYLASNYKIKTLRARTRAALQAVLD